MKFRTMEIFKRTLFLLPILFGLSGCASMSTSSIVIGNVREKTNPNNVKIYRTPPAKYEEIAIINTNNMGGSPFGEQAKINTVIKRLKIGASKVGANGILLEGIGEQNVGSINTMNVNASQYGNSSHALGTGVSATASLKTGKAIAIYVIEE